MKLQYLTAYTCANCPIPTRFKFKSLPPDPLQQLHLTANAAVYTTLQCESAVHSAYGHELPYSLFAFLVSTACRTRFPSPQWVATSRAHAASARTGAVGAVTVPRHLSVRNRLHHSPASTRLTLSNVPMFHRAYKACSSIRHPAHTSLHRSHARRWPCITPCSILSPTATVPEIQKAPGTISVL